ncbi:MAG: 2-oxoacid:ferredoxin oxidoreductase subunit gamma [candidate division Zixibacteria bacterium]|nr:2-oxoacid:ferredoxin oxidoreductase subunit gamma [candidate division Zixibacteria bacterium]
MAYKYSITFSGAGGHQLIQAARILAEAAAIYDNKNATESCSYGPEARGSSCRAEVIISDVAIDYPKADKIDFLIALTQEAYDKHKNDLRSEATAIIDKEVRIGDELENRELYRIAFMDIITEQGGDPITLNIVALGIFAGISSIVSDSSIRQAIMARFPKKSEDMYLRAFDIGYNLNAQPSNK